MTDAEIDAALDLIKGERELNNHYFIEWLKMSFKCPNCRTAASQYQKHIRAIDKNITEANKPLTRLGGGGGTNHER